MLSMYYFLYIEDKVIFESEFQDIAVVFYNSRAS